MLKLTTDKQTNRQDKNNMPLIIRSGGIKISVNVSGQIHIYLAYRTGQSADLTVIGNPVFILSRDLVFHLSRDQRN